MIREIGEVDMIALRRINGQEFVLNADFIESLESTPDTLITLSTGKKIMVKNTLEDVVRKAVKYKQLTNQSIQVIKGMPKESVNKPPNE
jgi:flagellar protein FlbD